MELLGGGVAGRAGIEARTKRKEVTSTGDDVTEAMVGLEPRADPEDAESARSCSPVGSSSGVKRSGRVLFELQEPEESRARTEGD